MITKMDDYNVHQIESTLDHVASSDPWWTDRLYFNAHDPQNRVAIMCGGGSYPNRNIWQPYINAAYANTQYSMVFQRDLAGDRYDMGGGPLWFHIIEPLQSWRLLLKENEMGIRADLRFEARSAPYEFKPVFARKDGRVVQNWRHYTQGGHYGGSFSIGGETISQLTGTRDRTWGLRNMEESFGGLAIWLSAHFPSYWITSLYLETPDGRPTYVDGAILRDDGSAPLVITGLEHDLNFAGVPKKPRSMRLRLRTADGRVSLLSAEHITSMFLFARPGVHDLDDAGALEAPPFAGRYFISLFNFEHDGERGQGISEIAGASASNTYGPIWQTAG